MANHVARYSRRLLPLLLNSRINYLQEANRLPRHLATDAESIKKNVDQLIAASELVTDRPFESDENYYEIFGFRREFDIDIDLLRKRYITLQKLLHPDKHSSKSEVQ